MKLNIKVRQESFSQRKCQLLNSFEFGHCPEWERETSEAAAKLTCFVKMKLIQ